MKPIARKDRLIKQVVEQDTLVYNPADDTACCLNVLASAVWRRCDGKHTVAEIAAEVAAEVTLPEGIEPVDTVWRVLDELEQHNLLAVAAQDVLAAADADLRRRQLVKSFVAFGLFPSIERITAPRIGNIASPLPSPTPTNSPPTNSPSASSIPGSPTPTPTVSPTMLGPSPSPTSTPAPSTSPTPTPTPTPSRSA